MLATTGDCQAAPLSGSVFWQGTAERANATHLSYARRLIPWNVTERIYAAHADGPGPQHREALGAPLQPPFQELHDGPAPVGRLVVPRVIPKQLPPLRYSRLGVDSLEVLIHPV